MPRKRRSVATAADTKTARWLDKALRTTDLYNQVKSAISYRLPKSAAVGLVEDHIQNHWVRLLEADALDKHVADESSPAPSNMRWWGVKNAYKDIREWGREPTLRVLVGAYTETDLKQQKAAEDPTVLSMNKRALRPTKNIDEIEFSAEPEHVTMQMDADELLEDLRQRLEAIHGNADKHLTVVLAVSEGATFVEAANAAGCTAADAKRMMREVAEAMADAK